MNSHKPAFFGLILALFVFFPLVSPSGSVHAQQSSSYYASPRINGLDVAQVQRLVAGTELNFTLYGTPGGIAIISIPGATGRLLLEEVETGLYLGTYTIKTADRIAADSRVTVNLRLGNQVASAVLDEPLIAVAAGKPARSKIDTTGKHPRIDRFDVTPNQLAAGSELFFSLHGAPGGKASIRIAGVAGRVFLDETRDQGPYRTRQQGYGPVAPGRSAFERGPRQIPARHSAGQPKGGKKLRQLRRDRSHQRDRSQR